MKRLRQSAATARRFIRAMPGTIAVVAWTAALGIVALALWWRR